MAAATKKEYHYVRHYASTLANGRPVEPSEVVELTKEDVEENKDMIDEGFLVPVKEGGEDK